MKCFGKSAHGSYPDLGENAIHKVIAGVQKVKAGNFQIKLTNLLGGESVNKVPDTAAVEFYLASSSFDDFKRYYKNTLLTDV